MTKHGTSVVYVIYNPDRVRFTRSLESIIYQVERVYIVDNSTANSWLEEVGSFIKAKFLNVVYFPQNGNKGISDGQNVGLHMSTRDGYEYSILSDQDTIYPPNFVNEMVGIHLEFEKCGKVAAVGPNFYDAARPGFTAGFFRSKGIDFKRIVSNSPVVSVDQIISSGMLVRNRYFTDIGNMDSRLFIDWVDFEWCWRARSKGYLVVGAQEILIDHQLGDGLASVGGRNIAVHSPFRDYYIVRNGVFIGLHYSYLGAWRRLFLVLKALRYVLALPIASHSAMDSFFSCLAGVKDALLNNMGKRIGRLHGDFDD